MMRTEYIPKIPKSKSLLKNFTIERTIGQGGFGKVKLARENFTNQKVAIKVLEKKKMKGHEALIKREISILKSLSHRNIVKVLQTLENTSNLYIVMEYANGGDLLSYFLRRKRLDHLEALSILSSVLDALQYMHQNGVCHR